jgi:hypothetical protein
MDISSSGTSFAPVACATLHYYLPEYACENQPVNGRTNAATPARPALTLPASSASTLYGQLLAAPNPARETVRLHFISTQRSTYTLAASVQLLSVSSGRVMLEQPLPTSGTVEFNLPALPNGVYVGRALGLEQSGATCKTVVVH